MFDNVVKEYLEYPENMSEHQTIAALNAAMKAITKLHRSFKSKLMNRYLAKGVAPFESYKHLRGRLGCFCSDEELRAVKKGE